MEQYSVENYLNNMHLRTQWFGGYNQEDVLMKMKELVEIVRLQEPDPQQLEELEERRKECSTLQMQVENQAQTIRQLEERCEKERQRCQALEKKANQLKQELQKSKESQFVDYKEADHLRAFVVSMEREKEGILQRYTSQVSEDEKRIRAENERMLKENEELKEIISTKCKKTTELLDQLIDMSMTFKYQIVDVGNNEDYRR